MAEILKGKPVADAMNEELAPRIEACKATGVTPTLAIIRVGERDDDLSYERGATKRCETLGLGLKKFVLAADCTQEELMAAIEEVNTDSGIHGCLMFRPLPKHLDEVAACAALDPAKDSDGITQGSLYGVFANQPVGFPPCTADACMEVLKHYGYELSGANVTVLGRSLVIGKPVSMMLQAANATVTMCHTRTKELAAKCAAADILVVAVGRGHRRRHQLGRGSPEAVRRRGLRRRRADRCRHHARSRWRGQRDHGHPGQACCRGCRAHLGIKL